MYIQETTAKERLIITRALDGAFISLDRAHDLLEEVIDTYFGGFKKKAIDAYDAERVFVRLEIVGEIIFNTLLAYSLTIGRGDARGVSPYLESAERAALAVKVNRQLETVFPGIENTEKRKEIMCLPDKQSTVILAKEGVEA